MNTPSVRPNKSAWPLVATALTLLAGCRPSQSAGKVTPPAKALQTFAVKEVFGVSHPQQIIDFDLSGKVDAANATLLGPDAQAVPYQLLEGGKKLAVQTDLPAGTAKSWRLVAGKNPAPVAATGNVQVKDTKQYYEISNGLTGVRVPLPSPNATSTAPLQGVLLRDGTWSGTGPNTLSVAAKKLDVKFLERGPLKTIVQVSYAFDRPDLAQGIKVLIPGGAGFYRSTIEVQAGQPSVIFEEETDMDISYSINLHSGLEPTQARYRGHHSRETEHGYVLSEKGDKQRYLDWNQREITDAFFDLSYDREYVSSYVTLRKEETLIRRLAVWDPWAFDSGWYWQFYNDKAGANANMTGIFTGRASRALGAANSGVGLFTKPLPDGGRASGLTMSSNRRSPDARVFERVRFQWGLFTGTKADLKPPTEIQPIARQMNLRGGFNLNKIKNYVLEYSTPQQGYGALYMEREALQKKIARVRTDKEFYDYLYNAESYSRPLLDMWRDASGEKTRQVIKGVTDLSRDLLDKLVNGDGAYDPHIGYWHGGLAMQRQGVLADLVLADPQVTPAEKARLKAALVLFAGILWDDDFVPLFDGHGLNMGTENMPVQQQGYRDFYALSLAQHPMMKGRTEQVEKRTLATVHHIINEHGAEIGSVHYMGASVEPTLNTLLQLRMLGRDHFKTEPRLKKFAEFYLSFLTPKEVRFGGVRKLPAIGDGSTETASVHGLLATGFRDADPDLSARLMGAWNAMGKSHSFFFGTTIVKIDESAAAKDPRLGSAAFPGWHSVLRAAWSTPEESALWFVNGDFYRDHRHADYGGIVLYALGAPLSIDWGPIYYPQVPGGFMHATVLPENKIGHAWNGDNPPLNAGPYGIWTRSTQDTFKATANGAFAQAHFDSAEALTWTRRVDLIELKSGRPLIAIRDSFAGNGADASKIFSMPLMAEGAVSTPAGEITPTLRLWDDAKKIKELPSSGTVFDLKPGQNRFGFTGQWGVDFDVYTFSDGMQQAQVGNWGHTWHPSPEMAEFQKAHARSFEERQHILRVKSAGAFTTVIAPRKKGQARADVQIKSVADGLAVTVGDEILTLSNTQ